MIHLLYIVILILSAITLASVNYVRKDEKLEELAILGVAISALALFILHM